MSDASTSPIDADATTSDMPLQPRHRRSETIVDQLRAMIMQGELNIGSRLPTEMELCKTFRASRTTLREAMQVLRSFGILDVTPGRGSFIRSPSLSRLLPGIQLAAYAMRLPSHTCYQLLGLLFQFAYQDWQLKPRQQEALNDLYQHTLPRDSKPLALVELENDWHLALFQLAGQPLVTFLAQILLALNSPARKAAFGNADELGRVTQLQMRINQALMDKEPAIAIRTYSAWCQTGTPPSTPTAI